MSEAKKDDKTQPVVKVLTTNELVEWVVISPNKDWTKDNFRERLRRLVRPLSSGGWWLLLSAVCERASDTTHASLFATLNECKALSDEAINVYKRGYGTVKEKHAELCGKKIIRWSYRGPDIKTEPAIVIHRESEWLDYNDRQKIVEFIVREPIASFERRGMDHAIFFPVTSGPGIAVGLQKWQNTDPERIRLPNLHSLPWAHRLPATHLTMKAWRIRGQSGWCDEGILFTDIGLRLPVSWVTMKVARDWFNFLPERDINVVISDFDPPESPTNASMPMFVAVLEQARL